MADNSYPGGPLGAQPQKPVIPETATQKAISYKFTTDEVRVINQCANEATVYRALPLASVAAFAAYSAVKSGYLKPGARFGPWPKMFAAATIGYIVGKVSYMSVCNERLMQLPNSPVGAILRAKKNGTMRSGFYENLTQDPSFNSGLALAPFQSVPDVYSDDFRQSDSLDMDTERPAFSGLDDTFRPSLDGEVVQQNLDQELNIQTPKAGVTYDELRRQNREKYAQDNRIPYYQPVSPSNKPSSDDRQPPRAPEPAQQPLPPMAGNKNKYGDSWT